MSRLYAPEPSITVDVDIDRRPAAVNCARAELVQEVVDRWWVDDDWCRVPISQTYYTVRMGMVLP